MYKRLLTITIICLLILVVNGNLLASAEGSVLVGFLGDKWYPHWAEWPGDRSHFSGMFIVGVGDVIRLEASAFLMSGYHYCSAGLLEYLH